MATGWAHDGAIQDQIDATVNDAVKRARENLPQGESLEHCEECGECIPQARRQALPGVRYCLECQTCLEKHQRSASGINRRASKDSQLR